MTAARTINSKGVTLLSKVSFTYRGRRSKRVHLPSRQVKALWYERPGRTANNHDSIQSVCLACMALVILSAIFTACVRILRGLVASWSRSSSFFFKLSFICIFLLRLHSESIVLDQIFIFRSEERYKQVYDDSKLQGE